MYDRDEILKFGGEEGAVSASKTSTSSLSITREVCTTDATHLAAVRHVGGHQMQLQDAQNGINIEAWCGTDSEQIYSNATGW